MKHQRSCIIHRSQWADLLRIHSFSRVTSSLVQHAEDPTRLHIELHRTLCNFAADEISPRRWKSSLCGAVMQPWRVSWRSSVCCVTFLRLSPWKPTETFILIIIYFLFWPAVMPDYCAVASHVCFISVQHFCIAQDPEDWTFDPASAPLGHTWDSKGQKRRSGTFDTPPLNLDWTSNQQLYDLIKRNTQANTSPAVVVEIGKFQNVSLNCPVVMFFFDSALWSVNAPHHHSIKHDSPTSASASRLPTPSLPFERVPCERGIKVRGE